MARAFEETCERGRREHRENFQQEIFVLRECMRRREPRYDS